MGSKNFVNNIAQEDNRKDEVIDVSNEKKNILIVHNYYQIPGGEDTVVANEKKMLEKHGHKVILYSRNNAELKQMSKIRILFLPFTTVFNLRTYKEIKKQIRRENIDVVHVNNTLNLISPAVYYAARSMKVPVVQTVHNFRLLCPGATFYRNGHICEDCVKNGLRSAVKYSCYRGSKAQTLICAISTWLHRTTGIYGKINYICLTEFNKNKLLQLKHIKPERVFVKPNFVENNNSFIPEEERLNQFVFVGRLDKLKGVNILFEAWKRMGEGAIKLIVCGMGPMEDWCKSFIKENVVNIEMRGFVPNDEALKIIANSKALVLPTQWYEGFPMSIVETFSVGTPVICSDLGNAGSVVEEGITGYKFDYESIESIMSAIDKMREKPLNKEKIKRIYEIKYSENANYKILNDIYTGISD